MKINTLITKKFEKDKSHKKRDLNKSTEKEKVKSSNTYYKYTILFLLHQELIRKNINKF